MEILKKLEARFNENTYLVKLDWNTIEDKLRAKDLSSVKHMENLLGEPAIYDYDVKNDTFIIFDTVSEMPIERCNITYNQKGEDKRRKANMPVVGNALTIAASYGGSLLNEDEYLKLQSMKDLDQKTSVWLLTPEAISAKGGALTGDKRYGRAFIYHNGEQSFYKVRGFRSKVII